MNPIIVTELGKLGKEDGKWWWLPNGDVKWLPVLNLTVSVKVIKQARADEISVDVGYYDET